LRWWGQFFLKLTAAVKPPAPAEKNLRALATNTEEVRRVSFRQTLSFQTDGVLLPMSSGAVFAWWLLAYWRREAREKMSRKQKFSDSLLMLSTSPIMNCANLDAALGKITQAAARAMEVQQVSVWLLDDAGCELRRRHFFEVKSNGDADGAILQVAAYPTYFQSLRLQLSIAVENAHADRRVSEVLGTCLLPAKTKSALHAAVRVDGKLAGLLALHHTSLRKWEEDEIDFAGALADQVEQVILHDARREAQLELDQRRNELAHISRVLELAELSGALSHHLNQPLTAILINAEAAMGFLQPQKLDLEEVRTILKDILADGKRAGEMIQRVRDLFNKYEVHKPVDLNEVVDVVLKMVSPDLARQNITVQTRLAENLPKVKGDVVQLQHLLLNLVANAGDAMMGVSLDERKLTIRTELVENGVELSLIDRGSGVPAQQMEQIFQPFFTTREKRIGLGLTVCRSIASGHGGELWATSEGNSGTTFHLMLPKMKAGG
jgi:C4-dicarboxylate-specific signal transduction histidine kinase